MLKNVIALLALAILALSCQEETQESSPQAENPSKEVVHSSEIIWEQLNPARGDQSPQAGTVWGDRKGNVPTGFLAKFVDGFSSPPHIHNVTYRAVVIKGKVHNDDPAAETMWMKPGSFWTQPLGEAHITSASGAENIAYVEIDSGPYLVKPTEEAFDNGERPVNIDASNIVWLGSDKTNWISPESNTAELSFLWESNDNNQGLKGLFVKLKEGFNGQLESNGEILHAVVIGGELNYSMLGETKVLDAGSYFTSKGSAIHKIANESGLDVTVYIRTNGEVKVTTAD